MTRVSLLLLIAITCALTIGCAVPLPPVPARQSSPPTVAPAYTTTVSPTKVVTLDIGWPTIKNWDADADIDGIQFDLTPKDVKDAIVQTPGTVSAQLWLEKSTFEGGGKGELIQQWNGIQVLKESYDFIFGAEIRLEYQGFQPGQFQLGVLEVTLVTPDGKAFTARATSVLLGE